MKMQATEKTKRPHGAIFWLILSAVCATIAGLSIAGIALLGTYGMYESESLFRQNWEERLLRSYSVYALADYQDDFELSSLKDSNFRYAIYTAKDGETVDLSKRSSYLVCTLSDEDLAGKVNDLFTYSASIGENTMFYYNVTSLWDCHGNVNSNIDRYSLSASGDAAPIEDVLYCWNNDTAYVTSGGVAYPVSMNLMVEDELIWDKKNYVNQSRDGWSVTYDIDLVELTDLQGGDAIFIDPSDVLICKNDELSRYAVAPSREYYSLDLENWNVITIGELSDYFTDYYLIAKVADPITYGSDDLFARSEPLVDLACTLRFLPFAVAVVFGVLFLICFWFFFRSFFGWIKRCWKKVSFQWHENLPLMVRLIVGAAIIGFVEILIAAFMLYADLEEVLIVFWFLQIVAIIAVVIFAVLQLNRLALGAKRMADGDLNQPIDTRNMFFDFKALGENINKASVGMEKAVDARMKSERFKTELISNVSHDIKTPLTSIISYVELLKKQPEGEPANREYLDTLENQSVKLKKLLESLIEASKASTGNIKAELTPCNLNMVLQQVLGEYQEKAAEKELDLRIRMTDEPVNIMADTKLLQRVLDNLFTNITKYSQPGTRVYVNLNAGTTDAVIELKNTSREPLNLTGDELMERFTRGDSSRNSEGNGLGLNIAGSLMEIMHGKLNLVVDGDLFKVVLLFPRCRQEETPVVTAPAVPAAEPVTVSEPSAQVMGE
ncbi:MAG: HAMP domain-containing histidine kinase [Lachnospiraceae bacterium]|nr:HAMP domain-containing histidine kinase [Lachnospiraceae bacterium]